MRGGLLPQNWSSGSYKALQCGSCALCRVMSRDSVMSTEPKCSNLNFYMIFKVFNNANPSEVNQTNAEV